MSDEPVPSDRDYGLVMPFVVCEDQGGPFDSGAFVAGYECGACDLMLHSLKRVGGTFQRYVDPRIVAQLDLIAMQHGYEVTSEPWNEHPDEWTLVTFAPAATPEEP